MSRRTKVPLAVRVRERMLARLSQSGPGSALTYAVSVAVQHAANAQLQRALRESLPDDLGARFDALVRDAAQRRDAKRAAQDAAVDLVFQQSKDRERARVQSLFDRIESARRIGQAAVVVAALTTDERRLSGATKAEITQALTLRRDAIRVTRVKEILGCTDTELKRWSADGRLPVLFRRKMPISSAGKTLDVRHWSLAVVMDAAADTATWRDEDAAVRRKREK